MKERGGESEVCIDMAAGKRKNEERPQTRIMSVAASQFDGVEGSSRHRPSKFARCHGEDVSAAVDMITQLPDDIHRSILSKLTLRDGVRLTVLSHRWKDTVVSFLLQKLQRLCLDWGNMFDSDRGFSIPSKECSCKCDGDGDTHRLRFVRSVDQFLRFLYRSIFLSRERGGDDPKINFFEVRFCFSNIYDFVINRWIDFAVKELRVKHMRIRLMCRGSYYRNYYEDLGLGDGSAMFVFNTNSTRSITSLFGYGLNTLYLTSCRLGRDLFSEQLTLGSRHLLKSLYLTHIPLKHYDLQGMLSCIVNVKTLFFIHCSLPEKMYLNSMHSLKALGVSFCSGIKELDMSDNVNLTTFRFLSDGMMWDFAGAPNLQELITSIDAAAIHSFFTRVWRNLPLLGIISLTSTGKLFHCLPDHIPTFNSVTELHLHFRRSMGFDVFKMVSLLKAYPNLSRLSLKVDHVEDVEHESVEYCDHVIKHLKEVEMHRFRATSNFIEFIVYLLRHAVSLRKVILNTCGTPRTDLKLCNNEDLQKISALQKLAKGVDLVVTQ